MESLMKEEKFYKAKKWFEQLREEMVDLIQNIELQLTTCSFFQDQFQTQICQKLIS